MIHAAHRIFSGDGPRSSGLWSARPSDKDHCPAAVQGDCMHTGSLSRFTLHSSAMKSKSLFFTLILLVMGFWVHAQLITNYAFTASAGTFTAITGGTSPALSVNVPADAVNA